MFVRSMKSVLSYQTATADANNSQPRPPFRTQTPAVKENSMVYHSLLVCIARYFAEMYNYTALYYVSYA